MAKNQRKQYQLNGFNNGDQEGFLSKLRNPIKLFSSGLAREFLGIILIVIALVSFLGVIGFQLGTWPETWISFLKRWFGLGSILIVSGLAYLGYRIIYPQAKRPPTQNVSGL